MAKKHGPGIRCANCGCHLDPGERCDCEQQEQQRKDAAARAKTRRLIAHNLRMVERAQEEWLCS